MLPATNLSAVDMTMPMVPGGSFRRFFRTLDSIQTSGFGFVSLTVASDYTSTREAFKNIQLLRLLLLGRFGKIRFVRTLKEIRRAIQDRKLAISMHFQGTAPLGKDLSLVEAFYARGIRHMLMAYNARNLVGYGCHEDEDRGITSFGRELIAEMNRVGMLVDVAHTGHRTAMDTIETSTQPVVVSHGNIWALHQHPRCIKDELIKAIAAKNGVIGITGLGLFMGNNGASVENYVKNIDYIAQLVGPEHVGIGLDYVYDLEALLRFAQNHPEQYPKEGGYFDIEIKQLTHTQIPRVAEALLRQGYSEQAVGKILGQNWLRVMEQVWQ